MMEQEEIVEALEVMEEDPTLITNSAYRANAEVYKDNRISFKASHMAYLKAHPAVNPRHYLSNLKLMIRRKP